MLRMGPEVKKLRTMGPLGFRAGQIKAPHTAQEREATGKHRAN